LVALCKIYTKPRSPLECAQTNRVKIPQSHPGVLTSRFESVSAAFCSFLPKPGRLATGSVYDGGSLRE
jgi:hypothetical protein